MLQSFYTVTVYVCIYAPFQSDLTAWRFLRHCSLCLLNGRHCGVPDASGSPHREQHAPHGEHWLDPAQVSPQDVTDREGGQGLVPSPAAELAGRLRCLTCFRSGFWCGFSSPGRRCQKEKREYCGQINVTLFGLFTLRANKPHLIPGLPHWLLGKGCRNILCLRRSGERRPDVNP